MRGIYPDAQTVTHCKKSTRVEKNQMISPARTFLGELAGRNLRIRLPLGMVSRWREKPFGLLHQWACS
jgi:hypothetical protein